MEQKCPYGVKGDRLWVKENHRLLNCECKETCHIPGRVWYEADQSGYEGASLERLRPSIFMPRWASRITLEILRVRVEPLQEISGDDALAEGCANEFGDKEIALNDYISLWESINGDGSWDKNPWVWAIEFKVERKLTNRRAGMALC
jgi:hypothetical protein